jgi:uncharacterized protein (TIGR03067 family)
MSSRLATARRQLAERLARRGLALSGGAVATVLARGVASACVPTQLAASTVKAAAAVAAGSAAAGAVSASVVALTEGVLKTMSLTKVKSVAAVSLAFFLATGLLVAYSVGAPVPAREKQGPKREPPAAGKDEKNTATREEKPSGLRAKPEALVDKDLESLQGTWNVGTMGWGDKALPKTVMKGYKFVFAGNKLTWEAAIGMTERPGGIYPADGAFACDFKIGPSKKPKEIDITFHLKGGDRTIKGIYEIKGDALKVCYYSSNTGRRPIDFSTKDDPKVGYVILTRAKKPDKAPPK